MRITSFTRTIVGLFASSCFLAFPSVAQTPQEPSIADAARRNREQRKAAPKPATVITNDTFSPSSPTNSPATSATATSPEAASSPDVTPAASSDAKPTPASTQTANSKKDEEKLKAEIAALKQEVKDKQTEVDLAQRLLNLDREAFLTNPDNARDTAGKAKLDAQQNDLDQKTGELEKLKAKLQSIAPGQATEQAPPKS
jgi:hypothetical protein